MASRSSVALACLPSRSSDAAGKALVTVQTGCPRQQVQEVRQQDHQGRDGPRRRSLLRVLAVGLRTFWRTHEQQNKTFFLAPSTAPGRSAPRAPRALHYGPRRAPAARHLSGEARASCTWTRPWLARRVQLPGPLSMRKRAYIERAAIRRAGEGTAGRDASAKPHEVHSIGFKDAKSGRPDSSHSALRT